MKVSGEYQLMDVVQQLIVNLKKQINDVRRDKERLQISIRGEQRKVIDVINKRKTLITEESEKIYMDFKETIGHGPAASMIGSTPILGAGGLSHGASRSTLHTPKGQK